MGKHRRRRAHLSDPDRRRPIRPHQRPPQPRPDTTHDAHRSDRRQLRLPHTSEAHLLRRLPVLGRALRRSTTPHCSPSRRLGERNRNVWPSDPRSDGPDNIESGGRSDLRTPRHRTRTKRSERRTPTSSRLGQPALSRQLQQRRRHPRRHQRTLGRRRRQRPWPLPDRLDQQTAVRSVRRPNHRRPPRRSRSAGRRTRRRRPASPRHGALLPTAGSNRTPASRRPTSTHRQPLRDHHHLGPQTRRRHPPTAAVPPAPPRFPGPGTSRRCGNRRRRRQRQVDGQRLGRDLAVPRRPRRHRPGQDPRPVFADRTTSTDDAAIGTPDRRSRTDTRRRSRIRRRRHPGNRSPRTMRTCRRRTPILNPTSRPENRTTRRHRRRSTRRRPVRTSPDRVREIVVLPTPRARPARSHHHRVTTRGIDDRPGPRPEPRARRPGTRPRIHDARIDVASRAGRTRRRTHRWRSPRNQTRLRLPRTLRASELQIMGRRRRRRGTSSTNRVRRSTHSSHLGRRLQTLLPATHRTPPQPPESCCRRRAIPRDLSIHGNSEQDRPRRSPDPPVQPPSCRPVNR